MSRGGFRRGAGRPKGSKNRLTLKAERLAKEVRASGRDPVEFLLDVMQNDSDKGMRLEAAKAAAPFVRPRLSVSEVTNRDPNEEKSEEELAARVRYIIAAHPEALTNLGLRLIDQPADVAAGAVKVPTATDR